MTSVAGGSVGPDGRFTAGRGVGAFPEGVTAVVRASGITLEATATVVVEPGPVHQVRLTPSEPSLLVGGGTEDFQAGAYDEYGNRIKRIEVAWSTTGGQITQAGWYTTGPESGRFQVTAIVSDGKALITSSEYVYVVENRIPDGGPDARSQ